MIDWNELRHHRVVKRLRTLVRVVGNDEGSQHSEEGKTWVNDWRRCRTSSAPANQRKANLTENRHHDCCRTSKQREPNHPRLSPLCSVRDCTEDWNGDDHEPGCNSIRDSVESVGVSKIRDKPRCEVKRGDIHREHGIREIVESPAQPFPKGRQWRIEVTCRSHLESDIRDCVAIPQCARLCRF